MRTLVIYRGLPGSGKSTEAAKLIATEPGRFVRINRDDLRSMCVGPGNNPHSRDNAREDLVRKFKEELTRQAFRAGYDVIVDDTHLVPMTVKKLHQLAMSVGDVTVIEKACNASVDDCIARDAQRAGFAHVGDKVIRDMARSAGLDKGRRLENKEAYYPPRWTAGGPGADPTTLLQDSSLPKAVICDLDGTLALLNGRSLYDASTCDQDPPNPPVVECVKAMYEQDYAVLFTSGREDKYRAPTERFIKQHLQAHLFNSDGPMRPIPYQLFMRPTGDQRKDSIVKAELFDQHIRGKYNVLFCLDDRNQVVDAWREMGLTCFQVQDGNF